MAQISSEKFIYYANYFALAASSGLESAKQLFPTVGVISRVDTNSFDLIEDAIASRNLLFSTLLSSYENIFTNAISLSPMQNSFNALSEHIYKFSNLSVDDYLSQQSIKVPRIYANISNVLNESVSDSNILSVF